MRYHSYNDKTRLDNTLPSPTISALIQRLPPSLSICTTESKASTITLQQSKLKTHQFISLWAYRDRDEPKAQGALVIYVLSSLSQKTISKSDLITVIHYTTCRVCEHRHVMHYTTHRICEHSHVMQHTLLSAEPLVRKFSPLSP